MEREKKMKGDWIRLASKTHPGRFYLFNKDTGETKWLPLKIHIEAKQKEQDAPLKLSVKGSKTPAQDRLKRLQHSLKSSQTKSNTSNTRTKKLKEYTNELNKLVSTSFSEKTIAKSPKKVMKRPHSESSPCQKDDSVKSAKYSIEDHPKTSTHPDSSAAICTKNVSVGVDLSREETGSSKELVNNENLRNIEKKTSTFTNIRLSIVKKMKEICKIPFIVSKKISDEKSASSSGFKNTKKLKTDNKTKSNQIMEESKKCQETQKKFTCPLEQITPKNHNVASYPRGSANSRLERLKQSLILQQQPCSAKDTSDTSIVIETNNNKTSLHQKGYQACSNESTNSLNSTDDNTTIDEVEAMDWQPITKDDDSSDKKDLNQTVIVEKSKKFLLKEVDGDENQTMGDIIDTVNENLLRFSAETQKASIMKNKKWRKDFYYFVVDTNVLLKDLTFIEDLTKLKLCDTKGSMLYIPYSVLQELDKLKTRYGSQEGVKTLAIRAIKYLNAKFTNNLSHIQAQSAVEERHHLVNVNSADDSIINCCLQAKNHIPNLLFLTEDVNLRNKAICNNIIVSTKSDLVAKRYKYSDIS